MRHYHVLLGNAGCMPDASDTYATLADARNGLAFWRDTFRGDGYTARGNLRDGYYAFSNGQDATIVPCQDTECLCPMCRATVRDDNRVHGLCDDCNAVVDIPALRVMVERLEDASRALQTVLAGGYRLDTMLQEMRVLRARTILASATLARVDINERDHTTIVDAARAYLEGTV